MPDKDRISGSANQAKGKVKEVVGKVTGDAKLEAEGKPWLDDLCLLRAPQHNDFGVTQLLSARDAVDRQSTGIKPENRKPVDS